MIGWHHPTDESDQWDGFNEPGIEHFSGSPIRHLAREVVQNSLDSYDLDLGKPVCVKIEELYILTSEIPGVDELRRTFELCLKSAENESNKSKQFFESGLSELAKTKIKVLSISDFNTKGMKGPVTNGTPYYAFMKAKGQSRKASETAAGSFGIGKFAPYAVSKLRTVFVSTIFRNEADHLLQYTQGKSILMSHDDDCGHRHQGIGFWGVKAKCQPVEGHDNQLPNWIQREPDATKSTDSIGTKLLILGFDSHPGWEESLAASIAENFFGAINSGRLELLIAGKYKINSSGINDIFENEEITEAIVNDKNEPEQFRNSNKYYNCIVSHDEVFIEQHQNQHLGLCELKILVQEGLPKKVAFLRNGMFISDSLGIAGLKNFSEFKDFVAVFQCKDDKGVELLRAMEPPRHDDFEPDRLSSKEEQAKARKALKEMATWIREMLRRRAKDPVSEITKIDELRDFFADDSGETNGNAIEEINPYGKILIKAKPISVKKPKKNTDNQGNGDTGTNGDGIGGGGSEGLGGGDGEGGEGSKDSGSGGGGAPKTLAPISNPRAVVTESNRRILAFTPLKDAHYEISLYETGADSEYLIDIRNSSLGKVSNGKIEIEAKKGERITLDVEISERFEGALKVIAHEI